jgi:hypothetical protein
MLAYQTGWIDTAVMAVNPAANRQNTAANQSGGSAVLGLDKED